MRLFPGLHLGSTSESSSPCSVHDMTMRRPELAQKDVSDRSKMEADSMLRGHCCCCLGVDIQLARITNQTWSTPVPNCGRTGIDSPSFCYFSCLVVVP